MPDKTNTKEYWLKDFSGGWKTASPSRTADNETDDIQGFLPIEGPLRSNSGKTAYNTTRIQSDIGNLSVCGMYRLYKTSHAVNNSNATNRAGWMIAKVGSRVMLNVGGVTSTGWAETETGTGADFRPIARGREANTVESFAEYDGRLYMTYGDNKRWDGNFYCVGKASCAGGTTLIGSGTDWDTYNSVRQGDAVFVQIGTSWNTNKWVRVIREGASGTSLGMSATLPNTSGYVDYIITRTHNMGVDAMGAITIATGGTSGSLDTNSLYKYKARYKNSQTTYSGNVSAVVQATTGTGGTRALTVSGWSVRPTDYQIDNIELYRTEGGGASYKLLTTLSASATGYNFASTYKDKIADSALGAVLDADADYHTEPPELGQLISYNGRFYARRRGTSAHILYLSTLERPEYWPVLQWGIDDSTAAGIDANMGTYVRISDAGDYMVDYIVEGGNYSTTGKIGSNLLIHTWTKGFRWFGFDWTDFLLVPVSNTGSTSSHTIENEGGLIFWLNRNGPVMQPAGEHRVAPIYEKPFPPVSNSFQSNSTLSSTSTSYLAASAATVWRNWWILAYPGRPSTTNTEVIMFHIQSGTWTKVYTSKARVSCWAIGGNQNDNQELWAGDAESGFIWQMFPDAVTNTYWPTTASPSGTTGVDHQWTSKLIDFGDPFSVKEIERVVLSFERPTSSQNVRLYVMTNGCTDTSDATTFDSGNTAVTSTGSGRRVFVTLFPRKSGKGIGRSFKFRLTGTWTVPMSLEWMYVSYIVKGDAQGRTIG